MGPSEHLDPLLAQKQLSESEILLRKEFARLFAEGNGNAFDVCKDLGFAEPYCLDWAKEFMNCCITRGFIQDFLAIQLSEEGLEEFQLQIKRGLLKEANDRGPGSSHSARVTAWTNLSKLYGMEPASKAETEVTYKGGVMVVPALTTPDEWGERATHSQEGLKKSVRD